MADGRLVIRIPGEPEALWTSDGAPGGATHVQLEDTGMLVVYDAGGEPLWHSPLPAVDEANRLVKKSYWHEGSEVFSPSGYFKTKVQLDGALVIYDRRKPGGDIPDNVVWSTGTSGAGPSYLVMQPDGNLALYPNDEHSKDSPQSSWSTGTGGNRAQYAALEDDGELVVYGLSGKKLWSSKSNPE